MGIKDAKDKINGELDKDRYISSIKRLDEIMRGISQTVSDVSSKRCPYRNANDRCTAKFGCRNQNRKVQPDELFICQDDQKLDYRGAWEIEPEI